MSAYRSLQIIAASREPNHALNPAQAARRARQHVAKRKRHSKTNEAPRAVISHCGCCGQSLRRRDDHAPTHARRLWRPRRNGSSQTRRRGDGDPACPDNTEEWSNGDQANWLTAVGQKGPADYFTGAVRVDPLFEAPDPARVRGASVTFEPGARTAWHTHPLGQTLIVTSGIGLARRWGGPVEEIRPGDVIWFPPGEKHWHGASPTTAMTHIAIQEALNGKVVDWLEQVTDEQYRR
jgi:quercetin dioxygenase-like cupin family protein